MRRRNLLLGAGSLVLAARSSAWAQPSGQPRHIGVLNGTAASAPDSAERMAAFDKGLESFGWKVGRDVHVHARWFGGDIARMREHAMELVDLRPAVIVSVSDPALSELQRLTTSIPVVFLVVADPVGNKFVASLAEPGGNLTGISNAEPVLAGKWVELLREIAPQVRRLRLLQHPGSASTASFGRTMDEVARAIGLETVPSDVSNAEEIASAVRAADSGDGLVVFPNAVTSAHGPLIARLAAESRVPAIYPFTRHAEQGGLISYGINIASVWQQAPWYVDRILRGIKPGSIPVQQPSSFELAVNLKAARALDLAVPPSLLARADIVIE
jgi:putative ABC transport system substrate-binding protein